MIYYRKDTDNIVTLILDMSGREDNLLNHELVAAFAPVMKHLKAEKDAGRLRGVIITSAKKTFLEGGIWGICWNSRTPRRPLRPPKS
jgi:3-hydroxyacyl-CoA dehydrogenase/enoyl-CoA hydratase/3-hydroxybutyryl-CoA epimerase